MNCIILNSFRLFSLVLAGLLFIIECSFFHQSTDVTSKNENKGVLSAGYFHTCAIESRPGVEYGGALKCWGLDNKGQASPPPGIFNYISCGHFFSCAIGLAGALKCWGDINNIPKGSFTHVSCGQNHVCGLKIDGTVKCWGRNDFGESESPTGHFLQVSCGQALSCGLQNDGLVKCWGKNNYGQANPPAGIHFKYISVGSGHHVCGIKKNGDIKCWGNNSRGQSDSMVGPFVQVSSGVQSTCAINQLGSIICWGKPKFPISETRDHVNSKQISYVSIGQQHACVIENNDEIICWHNGVDVGAHIVPLGLLVA